MGPRTVSSQEVQHLLGLVDRWRILLEVELMTICHLLHPQNHFVFQHVHVHRCVHLLPFAEEVGRYDISGGCHDTLGHGGGGGGCEIFSPADSRNVKLVTDSGPVVLDVAGPADHPQLFVREDDAMAMAIRVVQNLLLLGHDKVFCGQPVWLKAWVFFDSPGDSPWADSWQTRSWALLDWS